MNQSLSAWGHFEKLAGRDWIEVDGACGEVKSMAKLRYRARIASRIRGKDVLRQIGIRFAQAPYAETGKS